MTSIATLSNTLRKPRMNTRTKTIALVVVATLYLVAVFVWGWFMPESAYGINYADKFLEPSFLHPFGTDYMGRDMLHRSIKGLSLSLFIGLAAAFVSSIIGLILGISSALIGRKYDKFILMVVDCGMGLPHLVLLILISVLLGKGVMGVLVGVALTHWPELTRLIRAEVLQLRSQTYVTAAYRMGKTRLQVAVEHLIPHVIPVYVVGLILLFPHAIMHEAAITFLGFGLPAETPAIGVILSESMKYIATGQWWLAVFPGLLLVSIVILFNVIGENLKKLINPSSAQE